MSATDIDPSAVASWDPGLTERIVKALRPIVKRWFRSQVRGLDSIPPGGSLVVSNHSGGSATMDVPVLAVDFYTKFGYDRPLYTLAHDLLFQRGIADVLLRIGIIPANPAQAVKGLRSGGVVLVFPGGDYDAYRPTAAANTIDFNGRNGYVTTALEAGVPIVPMVSIGGQETQIYLSRGNWLAKALRLDRLMRLDALPITFGLPFGMSMLLPINLPLPAKIIAQVLEPIDVMAEFGEDADPADVDAHVRSVMQEALTELAAERRFPILG